MTSALILGSCVSRDAMSRLIDTGWRLEAYVARQSFISYGNATSAPLPEEAFSSSWQFRNLANDFIGNGLDVLSQRAPAVDIVLIDLVDERQGVLEMPDGAWVTNNYELYAQGVADELPTQRHLQCGSDEHFDLWCRAADVLMQRAEECGVLSKLMLVAPDFASRCDDADSYPVPQGRDAASLNTALSRYHEYLTDAGLPKAHVAEHRVSTSTSHRWGAAPFHYNPRSEHLIRQSIRSVARTLRWLPTARSARTDAAERATTWLRSRGVRDFLWGERARRRRRRTTEIFGLPIRIHDRGGNHLVVDLCESPGEAPAGLSRSDIRICTGGRNPVADVDVALVTGILDAVRSMADADQRSVVLRGVGSQALLAAAVATVCVPDECHLIAPRATRAQAEALTEWWGSGADLPDLMIHSAPDEDCLESDRALQSLWQDLRHRDPQTELALVEGGHADAASQP